VEAGRVQKEVLYAQRVRRRSSAAVNRMESASESMQRPVAV